MGIFEKYKKKYEVEFSNDPLERDTTGFNAY
jgi:hypothetical protein